MRRARVPMLKRRPTLAEAAASARAAAKNSSGVKKVRKAAKRRAATAGSGTLGDVDALRASLDDSVAASNGAQRNQRRKATSKTFQLMIASQTEHMTKVLAAPAFAANPFATLAEHITNSMAAKTNGSGHREGNDRVGKARKGPKRRGKGKPEVS